MCVWYKVCVWGIHARVREKEIKKERAFVYIVRVYVCVCACVFVCARVCARVCALVCCIYIVCVFVFCIYVYTCI